MGIDAAKPYSAPKLFTVCWIIILQLVTAYAHAQPTGRPDTIHVRGRLLDSTQRKGCNQGVIAILSKDSSLLAFTRAKRDGRFELGFSDTAAYIILFTHPGYSDFSRPILKTSEAQDLGDLPMPPRSDLLAEVIVTPSPRPHMRGDTLEYNTNNMRLRQNASVEEMLRHLPGVQVDPNGVITINGQRIDRLLVDGEDFFKGDPTIVTRNFNADMIAKVQVLDKKSRKAELTGVPDGQKTRTVNLKLKEDSKRGYFNNAEAGHDLDGHYKANNMLGTFKDKRQLAIMALGSNEGSFNSYGTAGLSTGMMGADPLGASSGIGLPDFVAGGAHYANHWQKNDAHLSGDYQYAWQHKNPFSSSVTIQTLPGSLYTQRQSSHSVNNTRQQGLNMELEGIIDSLNTIRLAIAAGQVDGTGRLHAQGSSSFNDTLVNDTRRDATSNNQNQQYRAELIWKRLLNKTGRSLSVTLNANGDKTAASGKLYAVNGFYKKDGGLDHADSSDQYKSINNENSDLHGSVGYLSPLGKNNFFSVTYGFNIARSKSQQSTLGPSLGHYTMPIDSLSSDYDNSMWGQSLAAGFSGNGKKFRYSASLQLGHFTNSRTNMLSKEKRGYQYATTGADASLDYTINAKAGLGLQYTGMTLPPSIDQLQPVTNSNDPLHIFLGNPDLSPGFTHTFQLSYRSVDKTMINVGTRFSLTNNAFSGKTYTDSLGRQISQTVNVDGNYTINSFLSLSRRIDKWAVDLSFMSTFNFMHTVDYINAILDRTNGIVGGIALSGNKYVPEKYSWQAQIQAGYNWTKASINPGAAIGYWTDAADITASLLAIPQTEVGTTLRYSWRQKVNKLDQSLSMVIWNAFIKRDFWKNRLAVKLQLNDILGQNTGISRNINANVVSASTYDVLGRYWMLSLSWRFVHHSALRPK